MNLFVVRAGDLTGKEETLAGRDETTASKEHDYAPDQYVTRLAKLVPGEGMAMYAAGAGYVSTAPEQLTPFWMLLCLFVVLVYRIRSTTRPRGRLRGRPQWGAVLVSGVSFSLFVLSQDGDRLFVETPVLQGLIGLLLIAWTFLVPILYRGSPAIE